MTSLFPVEGDRDLAGMCYALLHTVENICVQSKHSAGTRKGYLTDGIFSLPDRLIHKHLCLLWNIKLLHL